MVRRSDPRYCPCSLRSKKSVAKGTGLGKCATQILVPPKLIFEISFFRSSSSKYRSTRWSINQRHLTSRVGLSLLWYMDIWRRQIQKPSVLAKQTFFGETNNKTTHPTLTKLFPLRLFLWLHERRGGRRESKRFLQLTSQFCCCCLVAV